MLHQTLSELVVSPTTSFVPAHEVAIEKLLRRPPAPRPAGHDLESSRSTVWAPASSRRIRVVETMMVAGVMAYFAYGVAAALGLF